MIRLVFHSSTFVFLQPHSLLRFLQHTHKLLQSSSGDLLGLDGSSFSQTLPSSQVFQTSSPQFDPWGSSGTTPSIPSSQPVVPTSSNPFEPMSSTKLATTSNGTIPTGNSFNSDPWGQSQSSGKYMYIPPVSQPIPLQLFVHAYLPHTHTHYINHTHSHTL